MKKYFLYAIGEILLVMIGILLALQVNNWNESRNHKKDLKQIFSIVAKDLKVDLNNITETIDFYEELDTLLMDIIITNYPESYFESIDEVNYIESIHSVSRISIGKLFRNQERGIELLNRFIEFNDLSEEDLSNEVTEFYATTVQKVQKTGELALSSSGENFKYLEQFQWFKDYVIKKYNPETVRFFANDPGYKNKSASFLVIAVRTYLRDLKSFQKGASEIIEKIESIQ